MFFCHLETAASFPPEIGQKHFLNHACAFFDPAFSLAVLKWELIDLRCIGHPYSELMTTI
jgi:hypothetical protein